MRGKEGHKLLAEFNKQVDRLSMYMEKMKLAEYVDLLHSPKRLLWINFLAGIARGFGMAIGTTLLFALLLFILRQIIVLNLPVIGHFLARLIDIIQTELDGIR